MCAKGGHLSKKEFCMNSKEVLDVMLERKLAVNELDAETQLNLLLGLSLVKVYQGGMYEDILNDDKQFIYVTKAGQMAAGLHKALLPVALGENQPEGHRAGCMGYIQKTGLLGGAKWVQCWISIEHDGGEIIEENPPFAIIQLSWEEIESVTEGPDVHSRTNCLTIQPMKGKPITLSLEDASVRQKWIIYFGRCAGERK